MSLLIVKKQRAGVSVRFLTFKMRRAGVFRLSVSYQRGTPVQGYLAHEKTQGSDPVRFLEKRFLVNEVPLQAYA